MTVVKHTFLFREGVWRSEGLLTDRHEHQYPVEGEINIRQESDRLVSDIFFILQAETPSCYRRKMEMPVLHPDYNAWNEWDMLAGTVEGKAYLLGEHIILTYETGRGWLSGVENLERINDVYYRCFGKVFVREERYASWMLDFIRIQ